MVVKGCPGRADMAHMSTEATRSSAPGDTLEGRPLTRRELRERSATDRSPDHVHAGADRVPVEIAPWRSAPTASAQPGVAWVLPALMDDEEDESMPVDGGDGIPTLRLVTAGGPVVLGRAPEPEHVGLVREGDALDRSVPAPGPAVVASDQPDQPDQPVAGTTGLTPLTFFPADPADQGAPLLAAPVVQQAASQGMPPVWGSDPAVALPGAYSYRRASRRGALVALLGLVLVAGIAAASAQYLGIVDVLGLVGF